MSTKVIYSMVGVGKTYPPNKQVLRDISLSYFYGAKIGVIGLNGAGKSTLLRIMAGVEKAFNGETLLTPGYTVGYLEQEPVLDDTRPCARLSKKACRTSWTHCVSSTRSMLHLAQTSRRRRWTHCWHARPECKISSTRCTPGIWTAAWNSRWTPCAVRQATRRSPSFRVGSAGAWH